MSRTESWDNFLADSQEAIADRDKLAERQTLYQVLVDKRATAVGAFPEHEALRRHVKAVREHALENLAFYLGKFEQEAVHNGARVHYARDGDELNSLVLDICQQHDARAVAKGKSMVTEETGLTDFLERAGLTVTETDLGEYIVQQAGERPSHIVGPAKHKSVADVRALFLEKHDLGERDLDDIEALVAEARQVLRPTFLNADVGIIGANALIAEDGYAMLITNEGNGDLCASLPSVLVICTTLDRVLPLAQDATAMARLLTRAATGQAQTGYTSFYGGARREGDVDGPLETHFVLLDNGRTDILEGRYREMLDCIRCGACMNHCPVYVAVGGHAYDAVYPGPMGSVLTPLLGSLEQSHALPNACTTCGACAEVCPAQIPLPDLLRDLRQEEASRGLGATRWRLGLKLHAALLRMPRLYQSITACVIGLLHRVGRKQGRIRHLPLARGWREARDFPAPESSTFMRQYRQSTRGQHES